MSYIIEHFLNVDIDKESKMAFNGDVVGWLFKSGEFRPLMDDATQELFLAGYIDENVVSNTHKAYIKNVEDVLENYSYEPSGEDITEMKAAFGKGERVTNILTGQFWDLD